MRCRRPPGPLHCLPPYLVYGGTGHPAVAFLPLHGRTAAGRRARISYKHGNIYEHPRSPKEEERRAVSALLFCEGAGETGQRMGGDDSPPLTHWDFHAALPLSTLYVCYEQAVAVERRRYRRNNVGLTLPWPRCPLAAAPVRPVRANGAAPLFLPSWCRYAGAYG